MMNCTSTKKNSITYFGGKIINPKSDKIILYTKEQVVDTFSLDANNKFFGELKNLQEGLYYFIHGNENQHIYIEPEDSIMIRLNTWDFDESLVFAGKGADRNNILLDCFLDSEKDNKVFYKYNKLPPKEFKHKVDSLKALKILTLKEYLKNHPNETEGYEKMLNVALTYPLYAKIEKYPLAYTRYLDRKEFPDLTNDFYKFREDIQFNDHSLMYYPPYSYYIRNYLYNKTYALGHKPLKTKYTSKFTTDLLITIDKEISSEITKNAFLKQTLISHFYNKSSCSINKIPFDKYLVLSTNEKDKKQVLDLIDDVNSLHATKKLPNFNLVDYTNVAHPIKDVIKNKNSVLYFWNPDNGSEWYIKSRMKFLGKKYPNLKFIQINFNGDVSKRIKNLDIKNQYYITKNSKAHDFLTSKMPRCVLINKDGKIINGFASISSYNLKPYLEKLNNY